jgi:hypothetical protein
MRICDRTDKWYKKGIRKNGRQEKKAQNGYIMRRKSMMD